MGMIARWCPQGGDIPGALSTGRKWVVTRARPGADAGGMDLSTVIEDHAGVLTTAEALAFLKENELRWKIESRRWQSPCFGVVVTHSGPLSDEQLLRVVLARHGPKAALAGLTAAKLDHFKGFDDKKPVAELPIYVLRPPGARKRDVPLGLTVVAHQSTLLTDEDVHPLRAPRRTRIARSIVDAASWMPTDRGAMAILAAAVQQGKVRVEDLRKVLDRAGKVRRRGLMLDILGDIEGGSQALSELDFARKVIRQVNLPEPSRQAGKRDSRGRRRWIDVVFEEWRVMVEIDGAQHEQPLDHWDDLDRDNDMEIEGYRMLRFPAWLVRDDPERVAKKMLEALRRGGYRG